MIKKDIQAFDTLIQKRFNGEENTFAMLMDLFVNLMVQENERSNRELMDKIQKYIKNEQETNAFLTAYFEFSTKIVSELEKFQTLANEKEYKKEFKNFIKNILSIVPEDELQESLHAAMKYFIDVINDEYDLYSIPQDNNFITTLESVFAGVTPMMQLYIAISKLLAIDEEYPDQNMEKEELSIRAEIMFSFMMFANITRKTIAMQIKQTPMQSANQPNYKNQKIPKKIYQLKISIKGAKPPIWRRVLVASDSTFYELHTIIQNIFNWEDYHLYQFYGVRCYTDVQTVEEGMGYKETVDAEKFQISQELQHAKDKIQYTYDFGDDWKHEIVLEKVLEVDEKINYPICTAGRRNGPLEDCGGMWGYSDILYAIETNDFEGLEYLLDDDGEFYYKDFDPAYFDKDEINERLSKK